MTQARDFLVSHPFEERRIACSGVVKVHGYDLKVYEVVLGNGALVKERFDPAMELAGEALPQPAPAPGRPGVGFAIRHQGRGWDYFVLAWWEAENELPMRIWTRPQGNAGSWKPATPLQSVCVWDLQIVAFERDAYVKHILARARPDLCAYLYTALAVDPAAR